MGVLVRTVTDLARRGIVVRVAPGAYDGPASVRAYCAHLRETAARRGGTSDGSSLTAERLRLVREQADREALRNAALRRELLPAAEVEATWAATLTGLRARLLALPSRAQQRLGHLTAHDVAALDREVRGALTELGGDADPSEPAG